MPLSKRRGQPALAGARHHSDGRGCLRRWSPSLTSSAITGPATRGIFRSRRPPPPGTFEPLVQQLGELAVRAPYFGREPGDLKNLLCGRIIDNPLKEEPDRDLVPVLEKSSSVALGTVVDELRPFLNGVIGSQRGRPAEVPGQFPEPVEDSTAHLFPVALPDRYWYAMALRRK
ncbi:hypothetical protein [Streptomyces shenzhenensis]|uniref:hypothetical protein n=1 Tax=Streptomyces shenzhenensis TaxID=943815 RepID=UPI001F365EE0|nr:hypothetical protein [Streptomyces shenzhenensis]